MPLMQILNMNKRHYNEVYINHVYWGYTKNIRKWKKPNNANPIKITRYNLIFAPLYFTLKNTHKSTQIKIKIKSSNKSLTLNNT